MSDKNTQREQNSLDDCRGRGSVIGARGGRSNEGTVLQVLNRTNRTRQRRGKAAEEQRFDDARVIQRRPTDNKVQHWRRIEEGGGGEDVGLVIGCGLSRTVGRLVG
jgi:hypothetical protein